MRTVSLPEVDAAEVDFRSASVFAAGYRRVVRQLDTETVPTRRPEHEVAEIAARLFPHHPDGSTTSRLPVFHPALHRVHPAVIAVDSADPQSARIRARSSQLCSVALADRLDVERFRREA
jgi:hypothetical protein